MTEDRRRATAAPGTQHALLAGRNARDAADGDITDLSAQVAWVEDQERKALRRDRVSRLEELTPKVFSPSPVATHPREVGPIEIIEREEAITLLGLTNASDFKRLERRGVIRRAHPDLRAQFLYRDVAALALTPPKSKARQEMEKRLRLQNTLNYLSHFVPQAYYGIDGAPLPAEDMDYVDRVANVAYQTGLSDMAHQFRSLLRPVAYTDQRDYRDEHDVQFLYLWDEEVPRMTAALEMRRWYQETHPHTRYHVRRIALPPINMMNRLEHRGVLKFLVQSASILYGVEFEVMPDEYYEAITDQQLQLSEEDQNMYRTLTGARVSDKGELMSLLSATAPVTVLPLAYTVGAWYQAYKSLTDSDAGAPHFTIRRQSYVDDLLRQVSAYDTSTELDPGELVGMRKSLRQILGCPEEWVSMFSHENPPAYVGQPPSYEPPKGAKAEPDPMRIRLHPALRNGHLPRNAVYLMGVNSMEDLEPDQIRSAERVISALDEFHRGMMALVEPAATTKNDRLLIARLFSLLQERGIDPRSMYLYPIRDAMKLYVKLFPRAKANVLRDEVLPLLAQMQGKPIVMPEERPQASVTAVADVPDPAGHAQGPVEITQAQRVEFAHLYAVEVLGFNETDLSALSGEDILESMGESAVQALDLYIVRVTSTAGIAKEFDWEE